MKSETKQKRIAYGYYRNTNKKIAVIDLEAAIVMNIFILYDHGMGFGTIKKKLERDMITAPYNGKSWSRQTISNILSNPHYIGDETYPPIISQMLFDSVQQKKHIHSK